MGVLLLRVGQGDAEAFERVVDHIGPLLLLAARAAIGAALAEQVTERTLVQIWRLAASIDPERTNAAAWIAAIARQQANQVRPLPPDEPLGVEVDQVRCLRLATYRRYTCSQIADQLRLPASTVQAHLRQGLLALQSAAQPMTPG